MYLGEKPGNEGLAHLQNIYLHIALTAVATTYRRWTK
jgi:hypothetical protein